MHATNNATLNIRNTAINNANGLIEAQAGSTVELQGVTLFSGTLGSAATGVVRATGPMTLEGPITNAGNFEITEGRVVLLDGNLTNTGKVLLAAVNPSPGQFGNTSLLIDGDSTLDGGGEVLMSDTNANHIAAVFNTLGTLTNEDNTISGSGHIGLNGMGLVNRGIIRANQSTQLVIEAADVLGGAVNTGTAEAVNGATLVFRISDFHNVEGDTNGTIQATDSTLRAEASATVIGGTVDLIGSSEFHLSNGSVVDGRITVSDQSAIRTIFGEQNRLSGEVNNTAGGKIIIGNDTRLILDEAGSYDNAGMIDMQGQGPFLNFAGTMLLLEDSVTLAGGGEVRMSNSLANVIQTAVGNTGTLINEDHTIHGAGQLGRNVTGFVNHATIDADLPFVSDDAPGLMVVDPGGTGPASLLVNKGIMRASNGGTLRLLNGDYENDSGVIEALDGSRVELQEAVSITGGQIKTSGTGEIHVNRSVSLDGTAMTLDGRVVVNAGGRLTLIGHITNKQSVSVDESRIQIRGPVTLDGGGTVVLADSPNTLFMHFSNPFVDQLINEDNTISGAGRFGFNALSIVNRGTIRGDGSNPLIIDPQDSIGLDNQGRLEAVGTGGVELLFGAFTTSGQVHVGGGSSLLRQGDYVQTAGATTVDGTLEVTGLIDIQGGTFGGGGMIIGNVRNSGETSPGSSPGLLTINGDLELAPASTFLAEIDGVTPVDEYDVLDVSGTATLAGSMEIILAPDYAPADGRTFDVLIAGTILGEFDTVVPPGRADLIWDVDYLLDPTDDDMVRISVTVIPEPSTLLIAIAGIVAIVRRRNLPQS